MRFKENIFGNCLLLLSTLALLGCFTTFFFTSTNAFTYVVASVGLFGSFIPAAIVFTPLTAGKKHIIIDCIAFFLAFLTPGLIAIESFRLFNHLNNSVALVAFIISILICLVIFILIMNPKITKWAEMEKHVNEDGSATYQRPKYFVLAFSEWIVIFTVYLTIIPFIILSFIG